MVYFDSIWCVGVTGPRDLYSAASPGPRPEQPLSVADRPYGFRIWFSRLISSVPHWIRREQLKKRHSDPFRPFRSNPYQLAARCSVGATPISCGSARRVPNLVFSLDLVCPTLGQTRSGEKTTFRPFSSVSEQPLPVGFPVLGRSNPYQLRIGP